MHPGVSQVRLSRLSDSSRFSLGGGTWIHPGVSQVRFAGGSSSTVLSHVRTKFWMQSGSLVTSQVRLAFWMHGLRASREDSAEANRAVTELGLSTGRASEGMADRRRTTRGALMYIVEDVMPLKVYRDVYR